MSASARPPTPLTTEPMCENGSELEGRGGGAVLEGGVVQLDGVVHVGLGGRLLALEGLLARQRNGSTSAECLLTTNFSRLAHPTLPPHHKVPVLV